MSKEQSTIVVYAITGNTRRFPVPFEYLSRQFVVVTVLGAGRTVLTLGSDYRFISLNEIETTVAYGGPDGNLFIEIRRVTSATDRLVEFSDGSVLRSRDMNVSAIQTIHIAEEARNLASDTLASDDDGNLDARGRRLVNLGNAVNPKDAMTYEQVTEWSQSALNQANRSQTEANKSAASATAALVSRNAAAASQSASKTSETNAKTSETNAKTSETNAAASQQAAKTSETNAKTSENTARAQAVISTTQATNSAASATQALTSKNLAEKWAENPTDEAVTAGKFSAKHWADKAEQNAGGTAYLRKDDNLGSLLDKATARANLGLGAPSVRWPTYAEVTGKPPYATRWPNIEEVSGLGSMASQYVGSFQRSTGRVTHTLDTWWPNAVNGNPNNYVENYAHKTIVGNNGLYVIAHNIDNSRRFGLQVGHSTSSYASSTGTLELNPLGGDVKANGKRVAVALSEVVTYGGEVATPVPRPNVGSFVQTRVPDGHVLTGIQVTRWADSDSFISMLFSKKIRVK